MTDRIYIQFADNGNIRKWQRDPFEGGAPYLASLPSDDEVVRVVRLLNRYVAEAYLDGCEDDIALAAALLQSKAAELAAVKAALECALIREGNEKHRAKIAHQNMNAEINARERAEAALAEANRALEETVQVINRLVTPCPPVPPGPPHEVSISIPEFNKANAVARRAHAILDAGRRALAEQEKGR